MSLTFGQSYIYVCIREVRGDNGWWRAEKTSTHDTKITEIILYGLLRDGKTFLCACFVCRNAKALCARPRCIPRLSCLYVVVSALRPRLQETSEIFISLFFQFSSYLPRSPMVKRATESEQTRKRSKSVCLCKRIERSINILSCCTRRYEFSEIVWEASSHRWRYVNDILSG